MKNKTMNASIATIAILAVMFSSFWFVSAVPPNPTLLDPKTIPKYVNQLVAAIPVYEPTNVTDDGGNLRQDYDINMTYFREQILPAGTPLVGSPDGMTTVWGYQGKVRLLDGTILPSFANSPSATFGATVGIPMNVTWRNNIDVPQFLPVDPTIHWADPTNPTPGTMRMWDVFPATYPGTFRNTMTGATLDAQTPVPLVTHVHGLEVQSYYDGGPDEWFTYDGIHGPGYSTNSSLADTPGNEAVYYYPNEQQPTTLWYHDHALGMTRLNVMSGLAGYYLLRDPPAATTITTPNATNFDQYLTQHFPYGVSEIPLAIQDRSFYANGELWFPTVGINPTIHPYWMPEFFGNAIMVNGKVWPNLNVTQGWYRFRVLDGSNARFYTLSLKDQTTGLKLPFTVIGTEGGYLQQAVTLNSITIAPGERYDILVDFSGIAVGTKILVENKAMAPFPAGVQPDPQTTGQIMQFTVKATSANPGAAAPVLPAALNPTLPLGAFPTLAAPPTTQKRIRTLFEVMGLAGPLMVTINGQLWDGVLTETPKNGTTEDWIIVNLTGDTHPIHTHLATFQLVSRQSFKAGKYMNDWLALNAAGGMPPFPEDYVPVSLDPTAYLQGKAKSALPTEMGWKDTVQMNPGEVTIIRIRWTSQDGSAYPFDPTQGPGYVWHCHIVDHEDNEMMRPYQVLP